METEKLEFVDVGNDNNNKDFTIVITTASFALIFIVIGLPLWWNTTNVYRVTLPYNEIEELSSFKIAHVIPVTIVLASTDVHQYALWEEILLFSNISNNDKDDSHLSVHYLWKMRTIVKEEEEILNQSKTLYDLDIALSHCCRVEETGAVQVLVMDKNHFPEDSMFVGCHRWSYIFGSSDTKILMQNIVSLIRSVTQADLLQKVFSPPSLHDRKKPDKDRMRSLSTTAAFDITFSLIVPEPYFVDVHWDIENAVDAYVIPYIKKLSIIAEVDIKSQILYMISLPIKTSYKVNSKEYFLNFDHLPAVINPVEAKLGSYASVNPTLNFIVYIPPQEQTPLRITDKKSLPVSTNAFLSPQWGGFLIQNFPVKRENTSLPIKVTLNMQDVMEIFLSQLRLLLGLPDVAATQSKAINFSLDSNFCDWEMDFLLRKNSQEQLSVALSSLSSLSQLLQMISNIVINDDVGAKVYFAVSSIKESISLLQQGDLKKGFLNAKNAFTASEQAFFDPSLLALLYFPDDQKYAIYIPLFLPVGIPVIISLRQLWKYWRDYTRNKVKVD